uniref:TPM domain-containing protein n=1 Tax=Gemmiger formicilis TaxID=745368 RepID=UPI004026BE8D
MKLKTFARRAAAAGAVLAALTLAALPALAAPKVQVSTTNAVADHADILSDETEQYVNDVSIKLSDACGAQIGVYTLDELLGSTTMEGFAYDVFNAWGLGSDDLDNGVLLLLAPNEADGGDYYIMRGDGLESQLSFSTLGSLLDEYMEPYWVNGDYDTGTQKTVQALANRLCSIYGVTLNSSYTDTSAPDRGGPNVMRFVLLVVAVLLVIWLITYLMRPRGPRPPRGGGGGSRFGNNMFWYSMGRASRRRTPSRWRPQAQQPSFGWVPLGRRFPQRRRCRPQSSFRRLASLGRRVPFRRRFHPRRRRGTAPLM